MKNNFIMILIILSGLIIGSYLGSLTESIPALSWLNYGKTIGLTQPFILDLSFLKLQFGLSISFTIAGIIGMIISFIIYRKVI